MLINIIKLYNIVKTTLTNALCMTNISDPPPRKFPTSPRSPNILEGPRTFSYQNQLELASFLFVSQIDNFCVLY